MTYTNSGEKFILFPKARGTDGCAAPKDLSHIRWLFPTPVLTTLSIIQGTKPMAGILLT